MTTLSDVRDSILVWFAGASSLSTGQVLPAFRWLCEAKGCSYEDPTVECLGGVLDSLRLMALAGGSSQPLLDSQIAPFRNALIDF